MKRHRDRFRRRAALIEAGLAPMPLSMENLSWHAMARRGFDPVYWHGPMHEWDDYQQTLFFNEFSTEFQQWLSARELSEIETMESQQWLQEAHVEDHPALISTMAGHPVGGDSESGGGHEKPYKDAADELTEELWYSFNPRPSQTTPRSTSNVASSSSASLAPSNVPNTGSVAVGNKQSSSVVPEIAQHLTNAPGGSASPRYKMCQCPTCHHKSLTAMSGQTAEGSGRATTIKPRYVWASDQYKSASPGLSARAPIFQASSPPKQEVRAAVASFRPSSNAKQEVPTGAPVFRPSSSVFSSASPVFQSTSSVYQPSPSVSKSASPVFQPRFEIFEPTSPVYQPSLNVPTSEVFQPTWPVFQPTWPVFQPTSPVHQPSSEVYQPSLKVPISEVFEPTSPVWQPSSSDYQSSLKVPASAAYRPTSAVFQPTSLVYQPSSSDSQSSSAVYQPSSEVYQPSSSTRQEVGAGAPIVRPSSSAKQAAHGSEHLGKPPAADLMFDYIRRNKEHLRQVFKDSQTNMGKVIRASLKLIDEEEQTTK